jgi:predicted nucleotidyltransferase
MATLAEAYLTDAERRALDRLVAELRERLGEELVAVWLYGSRARGERTGPESDIDLLVIVESEDRERDREISSLHYSIAYEEGERPFSFLSVQVVDRAWLADRRSIEAFFIQEVDRDKVVIYGEEDGLGGEEVEPELPQEEAIAAARESTWIGRVRSWGLPRH